MDTSDIGSRTAGNSAIEATKTASLSPPKHLTVTQRRLWRNVMEVMPDKNMMNIDAFAVEQLVLDLQLLGRMAMPDDIDVLDERFEKVLRMRNAQTRVVQKWFSSFGMTPASRTNLLKVADKSKPDAKSAKKLHLLRG